eukprot:12246097-Prorocentrum_lima.AAC.1
MTSSLVGSEMCIRDSLCFVAGWQTTGGSEVARLVAIGVGMVLVGGWIWPVSYTHLTLPTICSV